MKIEAVVVCCDYSDFLAFTLPLNRHFFNRLVVVTSTKDIRTQKLCEYWHVQCIQTDVFYEDGSAFNKAKGINAGLSALDGDSWICHLDADIILPPQFRHILEGLKLDEDGLYTADRLMCQSFDQWIEFFCNPIISNENNVYVHPRPFPVGVRLSKSEFGGWIPIGYFQMWNQGKKKLSYPLINDNAAHSDLRFAQLFGREHRHMLGEFFVIHLETKMVTGDTEMGANWNGRKTPPFGPASAPAPVVIEEDDNEALEPSAKEESVPAAPKRKSSLGYLLLAVLVCLLAFCPSDAPRSSPIAASARAAEHLHVESFATAEESSQPFPPLTVTIAEVICQ